MGLPSGASCAKQISGSVLPAPVPAPALEPSGLGGHLGQLSGLREIFRQGETVFRQNEAVVKVYRIQTGTVRLCRYSPDGRRYIVDFLTQGELMGLGDRPDHPVTAEAVGDVVVMAYPRAAFERMARENMRVRAELLRHMSDALLAAQQHMFVLGSQKAKERVASFLLKLAERMELGIGERMELAMSRQDIADHLGLTVETVSRAMTALRGGGLIFVPHPHQIVLRDIGALRRVAGGRGGA
jgi:CRP-like cAMP-binding protein